MKKKILIVMRFFAPKHGSRLVRNDREGNKFKQTGLFVLRWRYDEFFLKHTGKIPRSSEARLICNF